jgi:FtsH-binding integral membrane protein
MRGRLFNVVLFGGLAVWVALSHPWVAPGFAALAAGQAMLVVFWRRAEKQRWSPGFVMAFIALQYLGLAYLVAVVVGRPDTARFWLVFGVATAVFVPVGLFARRLFTRRVAARER